MAIKKKLRRVAFKLLGRKNIDYLRYLKMSHKIKTHSKYSSREAFIEKFPEIYEKEMSILPSFIPKNAKVIIDVGANYGIYSFFFSRILGKEVKIFAFEPEVRSFNILKKIIKKFNLSNVFPIKKGLGNMEEVKNIFMPGDYTILAHIADKKTELEKKGQLEKVEITTLDSFIERNKIKNLDFIKCDVEGFEFEVFKGGVKSLKKFKPVVFVEIEERHTQKYGINPQDVLKFFKKIGYTCFTIKENKLVKIDKVLKENPLYVFIKKNA